MGVIYSYYDRKRHVEFDMGKWYGWSDDGVAVAKLFLPRDLLERALRRFAMIEGIIIGLLGLAFAGLADISTHGGIWFSLAGLELCLAAVGFLPEAPYP